MKGLRSYNSFLAGNEEEIAIFMEGEGEEALFNIKNPRITDVQIEQKFPSPVDLQGKHIKATITVETAEWEHLWGENLEKELPDVVDSMSVEELLHAVNKKIEGAEQ